jgi:hypothetical protein
MFSYPIIADFPTAAPPQAVWAAFEAVARWPEVIADLAFAHIEPPGPLAAGALIRASAGPREAPVEIEYRIAVAEAPHRLTLESDPTAPVRASSSSARWKSSARCCACRCSWSAAA